MSETTSQQLPAVAFLGLGHMGGPMAVNLVKAGVDVTAFDVVPAATDAAREQGLTVAATPEDAVRQAQVVITMFPSGQHVIDAYTGVDGAEGLLAAAPAGATFLDCSTINISEAQEASGLAREKGFTAADAPVSGGVVGATAGTLAFMVGGEPEVFERVRPLLEIMGGRVVHCGGNGMGQAAKICNNMILGVSMVAVSEAFVLAEKLGLEHQAMFDVVSNASGQCWALTTNCPVPGPVPTSPANKDYEPGFAGALMSKDLNLATTALDETGATAPMGRLAAELYDQFVKDGHAGMDFSGIITTLRERSERSSGQG
ncbi:3-hydroxyisobutyrate dehydrogenase [Kocuria rhizophila]|uniref:3-hydroxyisobutyrate dehydrogenase n=1 Tax=Kocuria rhizophila TaxID=72000 RepID=UPI001D2032A2|nr:3-hydroxyisobutyrate dehydrogenase [Kocuria rhizophila]MCC5670982.1 3-hydroxyisobutyrate dehydrogenase [Kocuria rhizophila]